MRSRGRQIWKIILTHLIVHITENLIFYVGCEGDEPLTTIVFKNLQKISDALQKLGYQFIFYLEFEKEKIEVCEQMLSALSYHSPEWHGREADMVEIVSSSDSIQFYESICKTHKLDAVVRPAFLSLQPSSGRSERNIFHIDLQNTIPDQLNQMIKNLDDLYHFDKENSLSFYNPEYDLDGDKNGGYDADKAFSLEASEISRGVKLQIQALLSTGQNAALLNIFNTLMQESKKHQPELFKKFKEMGKKESGTLISRLVVDKQYRIWLPDYNKLS